MNKSMQAKAKLRYLRTSPRKVRLVADVIRGLSVKSAQNQLQFMNKRAAGPMLKLLNSVIANAENNFKLKKDNLYIKELCVDEGPTLKRWMPRAMGRAAPINKRTSHISIVLGEREKPQVKKDKGKGVKGVREVDRGKKREKRKKDKDITVVKSLDEVREIGKREGIKTEVDKPIGKEHKLEKKDVRREGRDRGKQHLDRIREKSKGGLLKRMFRRKSI